MVDIEEWDNIQVTPYDMVRVREFVNFVFGL